MRRPAAPVGAALLLALLLLAPAVPAPSHPDTVPPKHATTTTAAPLAVTVWVADDADGDAVFDPGAAGVVWTRVAVAGNGTYTARVEQRTDVPGGRTPLSLQALPVEANVSANATVDVAAPFTIPHEGPFPSGAVVRVTLFEARNGTAVEVTHVDASVDVQVLAPAPPAGPAVPGWVWAAGALVVLGAGAALLGLRKRQVKVAPRSRTLQELEVETKAERARPKDAATIAAEYEAVQRKEAERLATREESILAAKRADIQKSIDLARQRHERGELSEFQYRKLRENKEKQLAELDRSGGNGDV